MSVPDPLHTPVCGVLGIDLPIVVAPMGASVTSPELAAAVSNAGGLGLVSFGGNPPDLLRELIRQIRALTSRPFGVNMLLQFPIDEHVRVCIEERVPIVSFFWGDATRFFAAVHAAGLKVIDQVGSVVAAKRSAQAGADVIIAQGFEAGGHIAGTVSTMSLVPRVVDTVAPTPVIAAGGIADARGLVAALALGAQGVAMGTRFLATPEANAHAQYKQSVIDSTEEDTVRTTMFGHGWPNAPHRTIRTKFVDEWLSQEARGSEERDDEPVVGETTFGGRRLQVRRFMGFPPGVDTTGDIDSMSLLAGQSVGMVNEIKPAAEIVREMAESARQIIQRLNRK